jgi:hypothetical protein
LTVRLPTAATRCWHWCRRIATLIARRAPSNGNAVYQLDLRLQGHGETVFFDV